MNRGKMVEGGKEKAKERKREKKKEAHDIYSSWKAKYDFTIFHEPMNSCIYMYKFLTVRIIKKFSTRLEQ